MAFVLGGSVVLRQDQPDGLSIGRSVRCGPALPSSRRTIHTRRRVGLLVPVRPRRAFPIVAENRPPSLGHLLKVSRWGLWSFFPSSLPSLRRHFVQDRARGEGGRPRGPEGAVRRGPPPVRFGASRLSPRPIWGLSPLAPFDLRGDGPSAGLAPSGPGPRPPGPYSSGKSASTFRPLIEGPQVTPPILLLPAPRQHFVLRPPGPGLPPSPTVAESRPPSFVHFLLDFRCKLVSEVEFQKMAHQASTRPRPRSVPGAPRPPKDPS